METTTTKTTGRPVDPNSKRQQTLAKRKELEAQGFEFRRGRQPDPTSKRQQELAKRKERLANGGEVKVGRPKTKTTED